MSAERASEDAIRVEDLCKAYGQTQAVRGLSFRVPRGTLFGLFGRNGSGKSTTTKILSGLLKPTSGRAWVGGHDIQENPLAMRRSIGVLSEDMALIDPLTAFEHMLLACTAHGIPIPEAEARSRTLLDFFELWTDRHKYPDQLSFGMSKKLSLAMTLVHNPRILFLDEPFEGLDPVFVRGLRDLLGQLTKKGVTIFLTSHSLDLVERMIHSFAIIDRGTIVHQSTFEEVSQAGSSLEDVFFRFVQPHPPQDLEWIG